ncbi:HNH endonuclease [Paenibacillus illinoisensis]|uniref:HNH endonuclease n=1 Tax=Paenibacillus illinoisensis TaxID=59845 RepID=UPI0011B37F49|nr:HNH endonuclease [Paenibacillus illinoisensis]
MDDENFYRNKTNNVDGYNPYCKKCTKKRSSAWIKANPEKHREHLKTNRSTPKGKETKNRTDKQFRSTDTFENWKKNNKERYRGYGKKRYIKKHDIDDKEWALCKDYFNNNCAYCGLSQEDHHIPRKGHLIKIDLHKEHVDDQGANDLSNCVPSCQSCNSSKWVYGLSEWYPRQTFYSEKKLSKIHKWLNEDHKSL